jgi:hypothetical protein
MLGRRMPAKSLHRRLRPYRPSGLYRLGPPSVQQQQAAAPLRDQLVTDHLNGEPTAAQKVILDLLIFAKAKHADAAHYLMSLPRPWCDKRSRSAWKIVHDTSKLERHVARLVAALVDPVLERRPTPPMDLTAYVAQRDAEKAAQEAATPEGAKNPQGTEVGSLGEGVPPEP